MILTELAPAATTITMIGLAVAGVAVFIAAPIRRHYSRRRTPIRADGALCRALRRAGHDYHPTDDPKTRTALAAARARLVDELNGRMR